MMTQAKENKNFVNEPSAEAYQIPVEKKVIQFLEIAEALPSKRLQEIVDALKVLMKKKPIESDFSLFLLEGPILSDEQLDNFKEQRKFTNQWRGKRFF
jgi:hypothetical protein